MKINKKKQRIIPSEEKIIRIKKAVKKQVSSKKKNGKKVEIKINEEKFKMLLDNMLEGVQVIDFNWRYLYVNDAFVKHAKYSREELLGYKVMDKYPGIQKTNIYQVYKRCFKERVAINLENKFVFPDGSIGWFDLRFHPVPEGIFYPFYRYNRTKKSRAI